jgi:hypothetical protein
MLHCDIVPEHAGDGELMDVSESKYVTKTWCLSAEPSSYEPDSTWVYEFPVSTLPQSYCLACVV